MNSMKLMSLGIGLFAASYLATPVFAGPFEDARKTMIETRKEIREEVRDKMASKPGIRALIKAYAAFGTGKLTAISGTTLTVEKDGKSYTVLTGTFDTCTTKFKRRYWGASSLSEFSIGDTLNVVGRWQNEEKTTIEACVIRDVSIQKRFGVFVGEVMSLTSTGWVMKPVGEKRVNQTVTVTSSTKFVNRKEEVITKSDILVGHKVRVKGMWDRANNTVTEVKHVKDYSLPMRPTGTPKPTSTP